MNTKNILLVVLFILIVCLYNSNKTEMFKPNFKPIIDTEPLKLYKQISDKEKWWNETHSKQLYNYFNYVPMIYKE